MFFANVAVNLLQVYTEMDIFIQENGDEADLGRCRDDDVINGGEPLAQVTFKAGSDIPVAGITLILLETEDGTQVKAIVPKEEADKLKDVKLGEKVQLSIPKSSLDWPAGQPVPDGYGMQE